MTRKGEGARHCDQIRFVYHVDQQKFCRISIIALNILWLNNFLAKIMGELIFIKKLKLHLFYLYNEYNKAFRPHNVHYNMPNWWTNLGEFFYIVC